jgi:CBS-domain-containing membrane protein
MRRLGSKVLWMVLALLPAYALCRSAGQSLLFPPLVGTAVIVFGAPNTPMARWRAALGGHVLSASIGMVCMRLCTSDNLGLVLVVGSACAFLLMLCTDTLHSPAGATPTALVALQDSGQSPAVLLFTLVALLTIIMVARGAQALHPEHANE